MRLNRILLTAAIVLIFAALATAAPSPSPAQAPAGVPSVDAFLATLNAPPAPTGGPATPAVNLSGCGATFCTQAQRDACTQQCLAHHHGPFVGLECCSNCTTLCICGSVPVEC